jgi:hypothetical protein
MQISFDPNNMATTMGNPTNDSNTRSTSKTSSLSSSGAEAANNLLTLAKSNERAIQETTGAVGGREANGKGSMPAADKSAELEHYDSDQFEHDQGGQEPNAGEDGKIGPDGEDSQDEGDEEAGIDGGVEGAGADGGVRGADHIHEVGNGGEVISARDEDDAQGTGQGHDPMDTDESTRVDERLANLETKISAMHEGFLACANGLSSLGNDMKQFLTRDDSAPGTPVNLPLWSRTC